MENDPCLNFTCEKIEELIDHFDEEHRYCLHFWSFCPHGCGLDFSSYTEMREHQYACPTLLEEDGTMDLMIDQAREAEVEVHREAARVNESLLQLPGVSLEGYCPLCAPDTNGRQCFCPYLRKHLTEAHAVRNDDHLSLLLQQKEETRLIRETSIRYALDTEVVVPANRQIGLPWSNLSEETRAMITECRTGELTPENFQVYTGNDKYLWVVHDELASPSSMALYQTKLEYHRGLGNQPDLERQSTAWFCYHFVGNGGGIRVSLDWIFVRPIYRGLGRGKMLFRMLTRAFDGVYIEAVYEAVAFFLFACKDTFVVTDAALLERHRVYGKDTIPLVHKKLEADQQVYLERDAIKLSLWSLNKVLKRIVCLKQGFVYFELKFSESTGGMTVHESFIANLVQSGWSTLQVVVNSFCSRMDYKYSSKLRCFLKANNSGQNVGASIRNNSLFKDFLPGSMLLSFNYAEIKTCLEEAHSFLGRIKICHCEEPDNSSQDKTFGSKCETVNCVFCDVFKICKKCYISQPT